MALTIQVKRIYEKPAKSDGRRILVDRLWPRGVSKATAQIDHWVKAVAPSNELRQWYAHDTDKWAEFKQRYQQELKANPEGIQELTEACKGAKTVTFLFSSKEAQYNNAVALQSLYPIKLRP